MVRNFIVMALAALTLHGCMAGMLIDSATQSDFNISEEIEIEKSKIDPIKVAEEVGTEMGFRVSSREPGMLMLKDESNFFGSMVTGHFKLHMITFIDKNKFNSSMAPNVQSQAKSDLKGHYDVSVMVVGGLGSGTESEAKRLLTEFKQKLLKKLDVTKDPRDR